MRLTPRGGDKNPLINIKAPFAIANVFSLSLTSGDAKQTRSLKVDPSSVCGIPAMAPWRKGCVVNTLETSVRQHKTCHLDHYTSLEQL